MKYRWKLFFLLCFISVLPLAIIRPYAVHTMRRLGREHVEMARTFFTNYMETRMRFLVDSLSTALDKGRQTIEMALLYQKAALERHLEKSYETTGSIRFDSDFLYGRVPESEMTILDRYTRRVPGEWMIPMRVSLKYQAVHSDPDVAIGDVMPDVNRVSRMTPVYQNLYKRLERHILWCYTRLHSGIISVYPGNGFVCSTFRTYEKYGGKEDNAKVPQWSESFTDPLTGNLISTISIPIIGPDGNSIGMTGMIVNMGQILRQKLFTINLQQDTASFMVHLKIDPITGDTIPWILARGGKEWYRVRTDHQTETDLILTSDDKDHQLALINDFRNKTSSIRRMPFAGRDCIWAYGPVSDKSFLVLITPHDLITQQASRAEKRTQEFVESILNATGKMALGIIILMFVLATVFSKTVTKPLKSLEKGVLEFAKGNFDARVDIRTRDEFGVMGRVFNSMGPRLKAHYEMYQSMALAMEVQQKLIPPKTMRINGYEIAGRCIYCDETGGDYYDFLTIDPKNPYRFGIVVGDVSDHGIQSALLMTTFRAFLRQRVTFPGSPSTIITEINGQFARDVEESGRFITLFFCIIDSQSKTITWVNAGHDPALCYDIRSDSFEELKGPPSIPIGVFDNYHYLESGKTIQEGQLIIIGTDGIWECRNADGEFFGKSRFRQIIRTHAHLSAEALADQIIHHLDQFRQHREPEDDITLVIIKPDH